MEKYIIIDNRMRDIEKNFLKSLGYKLIELKNSKKTYSEISSHVDIFCAKIKDIIIVEKSQYELVKEKAQYSKTQIIQRRILLWQILSR